MFAVTTGHPTDDPIWSEVAEGIPRLGSEHPADPKRRVGSISATVDPNNELRHIVTVVYSGDFNKKNPDNPAGGAGG